jgi:dinuclear metal center YbgI/SA1388 family protein
LVGWVANLPRKRQSFQPIGEIMPTIAAIAAFLEEVAPVQTAEEWDNVGLLLGNRDHEAHRVMTCLTVTPTTVAEAIEQGVRLIVAHHPMPFHALKRITADTPVGRMLGDLMAASVAVYSAHTAYDSAQIGVNQRLAIGLGLRGVSPLLPRPGGQGAGRTGWLADPVPLLELADRLKRFLAIDRLQMVGNPSQTVRTIAIACGAADEFLQAAKQSHADAIVIGETRFHTCLDAEASGIAMLLPGHYASERFAMDALAEVLAKKFPDAKVWGSRQERDPLQWG